MSTSQDVAGIVRLVEGPPRPEDDANVAAALAELVRSIEATFAAHAPGGVTKRAALNTLAVAKELYAMRRLRVRYLSPHLFGEPGWDILLDLYIARVERRSVYVSSACIAAAVPMTTALRWLSALEQEGLVVRYREGRDHRRVFVRLSDAGFDRILQMLTHMLLIFKR